MVLKYKEKWGIIIEKGDFGMEKKITVVLCLDDEGGMTFFGKRQSRDRILIDELCESTAGEIYITDFSARLFEAHPGRARVSSDPISECPDGGTVFIENLPLLPHKKKIENIILYKWNRLYPSDQKIDISFSDFEAVARKEFVGSSHDKITKIRMRRKG